MKDLKQDLGQPGSLNKAAGNLKVKPGVTYATLEELIITNHQVDDIQGQIDTKMDMFNKKLFANKTDIEKLESEMLILSKGQNPIRDLMMDVGRTKQELKALSEDFKGMENKILTLQSKTIPQLTSLLNTFHTELKVDLAEINEIMPTLSTT